jgi:hypothetical protein
LRLTTEEEELLTRCRLAFPQRMDALLTTSTLSLEEALSLLEPLQHRVYVMFGDSVDRQITEYLQVGTSQGDCTVETAYCISYMFTVWELMLCLLRTGPVGWHAV